MIGDINKTKGTLVHERDQGIGMLSEAEFKLGLGFNFLPNFSVLTK